MLESGVYLTWNRISFEFSNTISGDYIYLKCDPYDVLPEEVAKVEFDYQTFHCEQHIGGEVHIFADNLLEDSVRCFIPNPNSNNPIFYQPELNFVYDSDVSGSIPLYPIEFSGSYYPDDMYLYLPNDIDTHYITYYTQDSKTYYPRGKSSHKVWPDVDYTWNADYELRNGIVYPSTILTLCDPDEHINRILTSSPQSAFTVYQQIYFCGSAFDIRNSKFLFINHKGLLASESGKKWYIRYPEKETRTAILNSQSEQTINGKAAELKELRCFEPNWDITFRSMVNYQNYVLLVGDYDGKLYLFILDPTQLPKIIKCIEISNLSNVI